MQTVRLTTAQAIVKYLIAQRIEIDGVERNRSSPACSPSSATATSPCLGQALEAAGKTNCRPGGATTSRRMALAAMAFAKAQSRKRAIMIATTRSARAPPTWSPPPRLPTPTACPSCCSAATLPAASRPCAAAGREFNDPHRHRQRPFRAGHPLLGPHHPPGTDRHSPPARLRHDARPRRLRPGLSRPAPGRPGRGLRLPADVLRPQANHRRRPAPGREHRSSRADALAAARERR